jgi:hypothetical protein
MSEVTGPISTLPGARHSLPKGTDCDFHPDRPAVSRVQGETDSFGCEMHDLCAECAASFRKAMNSPEARTGRCAWCKQDATDLRPRRDLDEGSCGPVYDICGKCDAKHQAEILAELQAHDAEFDYGDDA